MTTRTILQTGEEIADVVSGHDNGSLGPSDTSDSGSDVPENFRGRDSDSQGTGARAGVEPVDLESPADDLDAERIVGEDEAGISHSAPDPVKNGGER